MVWKHLNTWWYLVTSPGQLVSLIGPLNSHGLLTSHCFPLQRRFSERVVAMNNFPVGVCICQVTRMCKLWLFRSWVELLVAVMIILLPVCRLVTDVGSLCTIVGWRIAGHRYSEMQPLDRRRVDISIGLAPCLGCDWRYWVKRKRCIMHGWGTFDPWEINWGLILL